MWDSVSRAGSPFIKGVLLAWTMSTDGCWDGGGSEITEHEEAWLGEETWDRVGAVPIS